MKMIKPRTDQDNTAYDALKAMAVHWLKAKYQMDFSARKVMIGEMSLRPPKLWVTVECYSESEAAPRYVYLTAPFTLGAITPEGDGDE